MPKPDKDIIPLRVPFTIPNGRLAIRYRNSGGVRPEEANHRLYLIRRNQVIPILSLRDLRNSVRITSPQAAYAYVSLPTSPRTFYLVDSDSEVRKIRLYPKSSDPAFQARLIHNKAQASFKVAI